MVYTALVHCLVFISCATLAIGAATTNVWPAPAHFDTSGPGRCLSSDFKVQFVGAKKPSEPLVKAAARYTDLLKFKRSHCGTLGEGRSLFSEPFNSLDISITGSTENYVFGDDESYSLSWDAASSSALQLKCAAAVGALRGLETFAQIVESDPLHKTLPLTISSKGNINDAPRFSYRGLMMDLSRHFYPVSFIEHTIDAMVVSKLNVLHLHLTDDQSFPVESKTHPELANDGAFYRPVGFGSVMLYTYNQSEIANLLDYAVERGVVIVPEFDMPAHSSSWGASHPEIMVSGGNHCSPVLFQHGDTLDPTKDETYDLIDTLMEEMANTFGSSGSRFLHLGGDEVPTDCWASDENITKWMKENGIEAGDYNALESYFVDRVARGKGLLRSNRTLMYWEEIFNNNVTLPESAIIQAWKSNAMPGVVRAGHRTTNSFGWYLNHGCNNFGDGNWGNFYENDPYAYVSNITSEQKKLVLGGETTMWSECVDAHSFDSIVWPRAAAAAEQLWSPSALTRRATDATAYRLSELRCRLVGRGVSAAPVNDAVGSMSPRDLNVGGCM